MKQFSITIFLVTSLLSSTSSPAQPNPTPAKPKIGIMRFEVDADLKPALSTFLYESFSGEMLASGAFTVVDWEQLDKVQKVVAQAQPNVSPEEARRMALHQLGIEKLYLGSLTKVGSKFYLTVKLLNLDLKVERSERLPATSEDDLEPTVVKLAKMLAANPEQAKEIKAQLERQKAETDRWAEVQKEPTEESLKAFLKEFPDGKLAGKAKTTLEEMRGKRTAKETELVAKEFEQQAARQAAVTLKQNIAGRWRLETTDTSVNGYAYNGVPGPITLDIAQNGAAVSFKAHSKTDLGGPKEATYTGTYISGVMRAQTKRPLAGTFVIAGTISEDGNKIVGNWSWASSSLSGAAVLTRMDSEAKP